jgi:hypothetical protein
MNRAFGAKHIRSDGLSSEDEGPHHSSAQTATPNRSEPDWPKPQKRGCPPPFEEADAAALLASQRAFINDASFARPSGVSIRFFFTGAADFSALECAVIGTSDLGRAASAFSADSTLRWSLASFFASFCMLDSSRFSFLFRLFSLLI